MVVIFPGNYSWRIVLFYGYDADHFKLFRNDEFNGRQKFEHKFYVSHESETCNSPRFIFIKCNGLVVVYCWFSLEIY